jgi:3-oxoacyl-[acyl-carrier protein] reductase
MDLGLKGKVAAVCAASKGLGRASAEALAREGCDVAICARGAETLDETTRMLESYGVRIHSEATDITLPNGAESFIENTAQALGRLDIVVGNVGGPRPAQFVGTTDQEFRDVLDHNLVTMVRLTRAALPYMQAQNYGRLIFITSISAKAPIDWLMTGNTARAGMAGFAKTLSRELASDGITVNSLLPENILTDRMRSLQGDAVDDPASWQEIPMKRAGRPDEFGSVVAFLASELASYVNGAAIPIDGGASRNLL